MTAYVCGFAFDTEQRVVLILKHRPVWQSGLFNGVGGKIEPGETALRAMAREFKEETGLDIHLSRWKHFHRETWMNGNSVSFYTVGLHPGEVATTQHQEGREPEDVQHLRWRNFAHFEFPVAYPMMYNLCYLVPMAYCHLYGDPGNLPFHSIEDH